MPGLRSLRKLRSVHRASGFISQIGRRPLHSEPPGRFPRLQEVDGSQAWSSRRPIQKQGQEGSLPSQWKVRGEAEEKGGTLVGDQVWGIGLGSASEQAVIRDLIPGSLAPHYYCEVLPYWSCSADMSLPYRLNANGLGGASWAARSARCRCGRCLLNR